MGRRPPTRLRALVKPPSFPTSVWFCNASTDSPHWGGPAAGQFVTRGGSFLHKICETWRTLVKTSNPHISFALIASLYIKIHKFNEEKPVWHWNVCSGSGKVVNRRDGPQQGDRLDLEGLRSTPGKPQTGLFVYFRKLSSQTTNSQALGKTFYNNLFGKYPQLRNQFNMSGQMNNAQASQLD